MRILVTGVKGQLGYDVVNELKKRGHTPIGVDVEEMDITDASAVEKEIKKEPLDAVIHCAAYTAVDAAEDNRELCMQVNAEGTRNIARVCRELDLKMVYISTDYVFDGEGERPWEPDDPREPLNVYGESKYQGELAVEEYLEKYFTVRIAWVFGVNGKNFIKTMLRLAESQKEINVVNDQIGSPTYTYDLAVLLADMVSDSYYPPFLVEKVRGEILSLIRLLEEGETDREAIQGELDRMTRAINDLKEEFDENNSEIETVARDSIAVTVRDILGWFGIDIDTETALRERDW